MMARRQRLRGFWEISVARHPKPQTRITLNTQKRYLKALLVVCEEAAQQVRDVAPGFLQRPGAELSEVSVLRT